MEDKLGQYSQVTFGAQGVAVVITDYYGREIYRMPCSTVQEASLLQNAWEELDGGRPVPSLD